MPSWLEPLAHLTPGGTDSFCLIGFLFCPAVCCFIFLPQISIFDLQRQMGEQLSQAWGPQFLPGRSLIHPIL